jgi:hypothetical protein
MAATPLAIAETWTYLVYPVHSGCEKPLHLKFRRGTKEFASAWRTVYMGLGSRGGDSDRRIDLVKTAPIEEGADLTQYCSTLAEYRDIFHEDIARIVGAGC